MIVQPQFQVRAVKILCLKDYVSRAFDEAQTHKIIQSKHQLFQGKFIYVFQIHYGATKWEIHRRLIDFKNFIKEITIRKGYNSMAAFGTEDNNPNLQLLQRLQHFLKRCLLDNNIRPDVIEFLEQSGHNYEGVEKYKEIFMLKKPGGRFSQYCSTCTSKIGIWKARYFIIHNQGIIYKDNLNIAREYLIYDFDFKITYGKKDTGHQYGIIINSTQRQLRLKAYNIFDFVEFIYFVKMGMANSQYVSMNRFGSYAPLRSNCHIDFYVDGEEYFYHLANYMLHAVKDIYITGWWVSPEFYLIRPLNQENEKYRLDRILKTVADRGVNVRILIYHEPKVLAIDSAYTKSALEKLSPNIKVIRHPIGVLQLLWSHHEKMVVIDQSIGFLGGLDICYGRYDTNQHKLFDDQIMYPGIDYNNIRKIEICNVQEFDKSHYQRDKPMLPWHDIQIMAKGPVVWDMSRHFIQYWNYASFQVEQNQRQIITQQHGVLKKQFKKLEKGFNKGFQKFKDYTMNLKKKIFHKQQNHPHQRPISTTMMFDNYINTVKDHSDVDSSKFVQLNTATEIMRQPSSVEFVSSSNRLGQSLKKQYIEILDNIKKTRKSDTFQEVGEPVMKKLALARTFSFKNSIPETGRTTLNLDIKNWTFECQMVRSVGQWSIGCSSSSTELSIQLAYIELITNAKHYIYIENQFFISSYADPNVVKNEIVHALAVRILKAYQNHQLFKVYVMLPLLPGFPGQVDESQANILRLQMFWQYETISRSKTSLFSQLSAYIPDPSRYIKFVGARTHDRKTKDHQPETQIIYIHSKVMIVDDEYVICGSANINDRSMRGKRDSELCMVCKDNDSILVKLGGVDTYVGKKVHGFRKRLFEQHFGFDVKEQIDPVSDYIWNVITCTVKENTEFYRRVFSCYPDDSVHTFNELKDFKKKKNLNLYEQIKYKLKGHAVEFPLNFLLKEYLELKRLEKESLLPLQFAT